MLCFVVEHGPEAGANPRPVGRVLIFVGERCAPQEKARAVEVVDGKDLFILFHGLPYFCAWLNVNIFSKFTYGVPS